MSREQWRLPQYFDEFHRKSRLRSKATTFVRRAGIKKHSCVCGRPDVQMHHPDYDKPLHVAFLCSMCHAREHRGSLGAPFVVHDLRDLAVESLVAFV